MATVRTTHNTTFTGETAGVVFVDGLAVVDSGPHLAFFASCPDVFTIEQDEKPKRTRKVKPADESEQD